MNKVEQILQFDLVVGGLFYAFICYEIGVGQLKHVQTVIELFKITTDGWINDGIWKFFGLGTRLKNQHDA